MRFRKPVIWVRARSLTIHALPPYDSIRLSLQEVLPKPVNRYTVNQVFRLVRKFLIFGGSWDRATTPFVEHSAYKNMRDLQESLPNFQKSAWYQRALLQLEEDGTFWHKKHRAETPEDVDKIFRTMLVPLLESMNESGYEQRDGDDYPQGLISRTGEVIKTQKGRHRLAAAQLADREILIPLKIIAIHKDWWCGRYSQLDPSPRDDFDEAMRRIELQYADVSASETA